MLTGRAACGSAYCPGQAHGGVTAARSSRLSSLPLAFLGSSATRTTCLGTLKAARRSRQCAISSSGVAAWPSRRTTAADTASIHCGCGQPEHRHLGHRRVLVQRLLDLAAGDVLAAGLDHVLLAVHHGQVALGVQHAQVAAVEPAAGERLRGAVRVVPVAEHRVRAAVHDLADLPGRLRAPASSTTSVSTLRAARPGRARLAHLVRRA